MIGIVFERLSTLPLDGSFLGSAYIVSSEPVKTGPYNELLPSGIISQID